MQASGTPDSLPKAATCVGIGRRGRVTPRGRLLQITLCAPRQVCAVVQLCIAQAALCQLISQSTRTAKVRWRIFCDMCRCQGVPTRTACLRRCYQRLYLPTYSSLAVMKEKLLYALINCMAIDTDG